MYDLTCYGRMLVVFSQHLSSMPIQSHLHVPRALLVVATGLHRASLLPRHETYRIINLTCIIISNPTTKHRIRRKTVYCKYIISYKDCIFVMYLTILGLVKRALWQKSSQRPVSATRLIFPAPQLIPSLWRGR